MAPMLKGFTDCNKHIPFPLQFVLPRGMMVIKGSAPGLAKSHRISFPLFLFLRLTRFFFVFFVFLFLGLHLWHIEGPRLWVKLEL